MGPHPLHPRRDVSQVQLRSIVVIRRALCVVWCAAPLLGAQPRQAPASAKPAKRERIPAALAARKPAVAVTTGSVTIDGRRIAYHATVEEHLLKGPDSLPNASLVTISYERDSVADRTNRPVIFAFNGGPGSSSSTLHMNAIGPRLVSG